MDDKTEKEKAPSVGIAQGDNNVTGELPDWYIRYLARSCEWEDNPKECSGF
jgi:hypothetical protein